MCKIATIKTPDQYHIPDLRKYQGIPGIEIMPSGKLFACFYCGHEPYEGPGNYVVISSSSNGGISWQEIAHIIPAEDNLRVFDPVIWHAPDGILRIFYNQCRSSEAFDVMDGRNGVWVAECLTPEAAIPQWSQPRRLGDGVMMNKPTVLHDRSWLLPAALWNMWPEKMLPELQGFYRANILFTNDNAQTCRLIAGPDMPERHFDEHVIVEKQDHSWWLLSRTQFGIGESFSQDCGKSWSPGQPTALGGPCSRFAIRRLKSKRLCLINHITPRWLPGEEKYFRKREKLAAWLSDDDGKTWYGRLVINPGENISYPDFTEGDDGFIYAIYDCERFEHGQIFMARFTEQDIQAGAFITPGATGGLLVASFGR